MMNLKNLFQLCLSFCLATPALTTSPSIFIQNAGEPTTNLQTAASLNQSNSPLSFSYTGWGADIPIWEGGTVNCFDADYAQDGTMFVAFQPSGDTPILVFYSEDHGFTWSKWSEITNPTHGSANIPENLPRLRILFDEYNQKLFVFHVNPTGYLIEHYTSLTSAAWASKQVSSAPIYMGSFEVVYQNDQPSSVLFYAAWLEEYDTSHKTLKIYKGNYFQYQWAEVYSTTIDWSDLVGYQVGLAFAPPETVYCSYVVETSNGGTVKLLHTPDTGSSWAYINLSPAIMPHRYYDARVTAANVATPAVWVVYNNVRSGNADLSAYHYDGSLPANQYDIAAVSSLAEYVADIEYYKTYPNEYVNLAYIVDDGISAKVYWAWSSQTDPSSWHNLTQVNDLDITPWPEGVAPRLLYSPGAPGSGSGLVFSYHNRSGLYFDAPWNLMPKLLIITPAEFKQAIQPLADWKNQTGITTFIIELEDITGTGDTPARIKQKIDEYYQNYAVRYIMLVGDSEILPVRYTVLGYEQANPYKDAYLDDTLLGWSWCTGGAWHPSMAPFVVRFWGSDMYYADLYDTSGVYQTWGLAGTAYYGPWFKDVFNPSGIDLVPDVSLGRLPASNIQEVENFVAKVIAYESSANDSTWKDKVLIITNDERPEWVTYGSSVADGFETAGFNTALIVLDSSAGEVADEYLRDATQEGFGVLLYIGHGAYGLGLVGDHWSETTNAFPVVAHIGCDAGTFNHNNLGFNAYQDTSTIEYCGYAYDGTPGCTNIPRACESFPPSPNTLQPDDNDIGNAESLIVKYRNRGGIGYQGANYATQDPSYYIGGWFLLAYAHGRRFMGDMHSDALRDWYQTISTAQVPSTYWDSILGVNVWYWQPSELYITHTKYNLFGDPTLRVGGILSQFDIPPTHFIILPLLMR
jgi:hypothetical protein